MGSVSSQQIPALQETLSPIPETESQKAKSYAEDAAAAPAPAHMQHNGPSALSPPMQSQQTTSDTRDAPGQLEATYGSAQRSDSVTKDETIFNGNSEFWFCTRFTHD